MRWKRQRSWPSSPPSHISPCHSCHGPELPFCKLHKFRKHPCRRCSRRDPCNRLFLFHRIPGLAYTLPHRRRLRGLQESRLPNLAQHCQFDLDYLPLALRRKLWWVFASLAITRQALTTPHLIDWIIMWLSQHPAWAEARELVIDTSSFGLELDIYGDTKSAGRKVRFAGAYDYTHQATMAIDTKGICRPACTHITASPSS